MIIFIMLALANVGCTQNRTYLSEKEKAWNPYVAGQILVFGTADGRTDTLKIVKVEDMRFPDGLGALQNERLRVMAKVRSTSLSKKPIEAMVLYLTAEAPKYPSQIDFEIYLDNGHFWGRGYPINELEDLNEFSLQIQNHILDDVIRIDDNSNQPLRGNDIGTIYWSKSAGYIKCVKNDGTAWELINEIPVRPSGR